jgi:hypothetical protein
MQYRFSYCSRGDIVLRGAWGDIVWRIDTIEYIRHNNRSLIQVIVDSWFSIQSHQQLVSHIFRNVYGITAKIMLHNDIGLYRIVMDNHNFTKFMVVFGDRIDSRTDIEKAFYDIYDWP